MKTNKLGTIVELDPTKNYIMLIDETAMPIEHIANIKLDNGTIIVAKDIGDNIKFVENSERIIDIQQSTNEQI